MYSKGLNTDYYVRKLLDRIHGKNVVKQNAIFSESKIGGFEQGTDIYQSIKDAEIVLDFCGGSSTCRCEMWKHRQGMLTV